MSALGISFAKQLKLSRTFGPLAKKLADKYANLAGYRSHGLRYDDILIEESATVQKVSTALYHHLRSYWSPRRPFSVPRRRQRPLESCGGLEEAMKRLRASRAPVGGRQMSDEGWLLYLRRRNWPSRCEARNTGVAVVSRRLFIDFAPQPLRAFETMY